MIDRAHDLPITKQAEALNISRGSVYYLPKPLGLLAGHRSRTERAFCGSQSRLPKFNAIVVAKIHGVLNIH